MGLSFIKSSSCACETPSPVAPALAPKFEILKLETFGEFVLAEVLYPDSTNYEGRKVMVYFAKLTDIANAKELDPHFCDGGHLSPIARFAPTSTGRRAARMLCRLLSNA